VGQGNRTFRWREHSKGFFHHRSSACFEPKIHGVYCVRGMARVLDRVLRLAGLWAVSRGARWVSWGLTGPGAGVGPCALGLALCLYDFVETKFVYFGDAAGVAPIHHTNAGQAARKATEKADRLASCQKDNYQRGGREDMIFRRRREDRRRHRRREDNRRHRRHDRRDDHGRHGPRHR
jgi:hypothetical protein